MPITKLRKIRSKSWNLRGRKILLMRSACQSASIPDQSADLVLTDPPYGTTDAEWDQRPDAKQLGELLDRIAKPGARRIVFAAQPFVTELIHAWRKLYRYDLIWAKRRPVGFLNANRQPMRGHEHVLVFGRGTGYYSPQKSKGEPYQRKVCASKQTELYRTFKTRDSINHGDRHPTSVLHFDVEERGWHSCQKPIGLLEFLIKSFSPEGAVVCDPFSGSGSTAVACLKSGRRFIGCERDPNIYTRAVQRIDKCHADQRRSLCKKKGS